MPTRCHIVPKSDLTADQYKQLAQTVRSVLHCVDSYDEGALNDLESGEAPRPLLMRLTDRAMADPRSQDVSRQHVQMAIFHRLQSKANSPLFELVIDDQANPAASQECERCCQELLRQGLVLDASIGGEKLQE